MRSMIRKELKESARRYSGVEKIITVGDFVFVVEVASVFA